MSFEFKNKNSFNDRYKDSQKVKKTYEDRVPIIVERHPSAITIPKINKTKYLAPMTMTLGQFLVVIRKRIQLNQEQTIFFFINNTIQPFSLSMSEIYNNYADADGFLYIHYTTENTFG